MAAFGGGVLFREGLGERTRVRFFEDAGAVRFASAGVVRCALGELCGVRLGWIGWISS